MRKHLEGQGNLPWLLGFSWSTFFPPLFHAECQPEDLDVIYLDATGKPWSSHPLIGRQIQPQKSHWYLNWRTCSTLCFPWDVVWANFSVIDSLEKAKMDISHWENNPCYSVSCFTFLFVPCPGVGRKIALCFIMEFRQKENCSCTNSTACL